MSEEHIIYNKKRKNFQQNFLTISRNHYNKTENEINKRLLPEYHHQSPKLHTNFSRIHYKNLLIRNSLINRRKKGNL